MKFLSLEGEQIGEAVRLSTEPAGSSAYPVIIYTGTEYGVAWSTNIGMYGDLRFERILPDGTPLGNETIVFDQFLYGFSVGIAYTNGVYALTFNDGSNVYLLLVGCDQP